MSNVRVKTGAVEPITIYIVGVNGQPLTGLTDIVIRVRRFSDSLFLDFADDTFKAVPGTINSATLSEVDATNAPGLYELGGGLDLSVFTNTTPDDAYAIIPVQTTGTNARLPAPGEIKEGQLADDIDDILTDTNEMQGKLPTNNIMGSSVKTDKDDEIDAILADTSAIDGRLPADPASDTNVNANETKIDAVQTDVTAILADTADMQPKLGTPAADISADIAAVKAETALIDAKTTNLPVDPASETNVDANETKIDAMQTDVTAILADTNAIDGRLPSDPADESLQQAAHAQTQADIAALENISTTEVENAVWDATIASHQTAGSTGEALGNADSPTLTEIVDGVWDEPLSGHTAGGTSGQAQNRLDADISSRSSHDASDVDTQLSGTHGTGSWEGATEADIADAVWDEQLSGHTDAGSAGKTLADVSGSSATPAQIADAVWDEALAGHAGAGSAGEAQARLDDDVSSRAIAGDAMTLEAGAVDANALDTTAVAEIADGVWDEQLSGHTTAGSTGQAQNRLDADISSRAAPGADMGLVTGALDADAVATSGAQEIADQVWDEDLSGHITGGTAGEAQNRIDADVSSRAEPGDQMALTVPERAAITDAVWDEPTSGHQTSGTTGKALTDAGATADPGAIADAVWDEGAAAHTGAGSMGQLQNRLDANVSTRAAVGDPMDLQTGALDADAVATSGANEIRDAILSDSTPFAGANIDAAITSRAAPGDAMDLVTDAVDSNALATGAADDIADQVWEEQIGDHSGTVGSTAEALASGVAPPTPAAIADAVWDEALSGHTGAGSAGEAQNHLDADVSSRSDHDAADVDSQLTGSHGGGAWTSATGFATPGDVAAEHAATRLQTAADIASAHAVTDGDIAAVPGLTAAQVTADHGAGSYETATGFSTHSPADTADAVWDELLAGHTSPGSAGEAQVDAGAGGDPAAIADAVWDEAQADHVAPGSMGESQETAALAGNNAAKIDAIATLDPSAATPGSLLDRLCNKDSGQTYDQETDSLEGIRDRVG